MGQKCVAGRDRPSALGLIATHGEVYLPHTDDVEFVHMHANGLDHALSCWQFLLVKCRNLGRFSVPISLRIYKIFFVRFDDTFYCIYDSHIIT